MVQMWCQHCTDRIQNNFYSALMLSSSSSQKRDDHLQECRLLARAMSKDGPFLLGNRLSLFEVAFAPFYQRMLWVGEHYLELKFPIDEPEFQRLNTWWKAICARPSVSATLVSKPRLIASYSQYANNVAASDYAK
jgi:glutathione S-transferase